MDTGEMMIIAHRGASGSAPENTMAAFQTAIRLGADWLELDVRASRDGAVVVFHDDTLHRTTNGRGRVGDASLAELKRLDAGGWFGPEFAGERILTLNEALALAKARGVGLLIEIKQSPQPDGGFEERVASQVIRAGMQARSIVMSFDHETVRRAKQAEPRLRTLLLFGKRIRAERAIEKVRECRAEGVSMEHALASRKWVATVRANGLRVVVWTVNSVGSMRRQAAAGVDGITTNFPDRLVKLLGRPRDKSRPMNYSGGVRHLKLP